MRTVPVTTFGPESTPGMLWRDLREAVGPDLPQPEVHEDADRTWIVWDTPTYDVRVEVPNRSVVWARIMRAEHDEPVTSKWEGRTKRTGCRTAGEGTVRCPTLALWLGRLCGEAAASGGRQP